MSQRLLAALCTLVTLAACVQDPVRPAPRNADRTVDARAQVQAQAQAREQAQQQQKRLWGKPAADAPAALAQFGQLAGRWECVVEEHDALRGWRERPGSALWTWFYTLGGRAVQDIWAPRGGEGEVAAAGTNLRVYDPGDDIWRSVWTSSDRPQFEQWQGSAAGGEIVMQTGRGERRAQITFFDIGQTSFHWRYETFAGGAWQAALRTRCERIG